MPTPISSKIVSRQSYYRQFLNLARKEEKPTDKLKEMIKAAEDMIKAFDLGKKLSLQNQ